MDMTDICYVLTDICFLCRDDDRYTPLFHAALVGCPATVETLLHYGADINCLEKNRVSRNLSA